MLAAVLLLCLSHIACVADSGNPYLGSPTSPASAPSTLRGGFSSSLIAAGKPLLSAKLAAARSGLDSPPELRVGSSTLDSIICGIGYQSDVESALATGQAEPDDLARAKVLSTNDF